jgi:hypothetical protein
VKERERERERERCGRGWSVRQMGLEGMRKRESGSEKKRSFRWEKDAKPESDVHSQTDQNSLESKQKRILDHI